MSNPYYPDNMSKADYAYLDDDGDMERWFEQNEEDLAEQFFIKYGFTHDEDQRLWSRFVDERWLAVGC